MLRWDLETEATAQWWGLLVSPERNLLEWVQDSTVKFKFHCLWAGACCRRISCYVVNMYAHVLTVTCLQLDAHLSVILLKWKVPKTIKFCWKHITMGYREQKQGQVGRTQRNTFLDFPSPSPLWIICKRYSQFSENTLTPVWVKEILLWCKEQVGHIF